MPTNSNRISFLLSAALFGLLVGVVDAGRLVAFPDLLIFSLLGLFAGLAVGVVQAGTSLLLERRWPLLLITLCALAIAPASYAAHHVAHSATMMHHLSPKVGWPLFSLIFSILLGGWAFIAMWLHRRPFSSKALRLIATLLSTGLSAGLVSEAFSLNALHAPLSLFVIIIALLTVQTGTGGIGPSMIKWSKKPVWIGATLTGAALLVFCLVWPISPQGAFAATDDGLLAQWTVKVARTTDLDDLLKSKHQKDNSSKINGFQYPVDESLLPLLPEKSVLFISMDATRSDHMGFMGYKRPVSRFLDRLAKKAIVFENAFSSSSTSAFSIPSMLSGIHLENTIRTKSYLPPFLPSFMKKAGYSTVGLYTDKIFSVAKSASMRVRYTQFGLDRMRYSKEDAVKDTDIFAKLLEKTPSNRIFGWLHLFDPHHSYQCHDAPFGKGDLNCYDAEIQYADRALEKFVALAQKKMNDPIIVFTADHGEAFGEHGKKWHSTNIYNEQVHVPLFILVPGLSPRRVATPVSNIQIVQTILHLVGANRTPHPDDLRPLMVANPQTGPVVTGLGAKRGLISGHMKLVCNQVPKGPCALYNLAKDPKEEKNLAGGQPEQMLEMLQTLVSIKDSQEKARDQRPPYGVAIWRLLGSRAWPKLRQQALNRTVLGKERLRDVALARIPAAAELLQQAAARMDPDSISWGCVGLGFLNRPCNQSILMERFDKTRDPRTKTYLAGALARQGNNIGVDLLYKYVRKSRILQTRLDIVDNMGALGDPKLLPLLRRVRKDPLLTAAAQKAIDQINSHHRTPFRPARKGISRSAKSPSADKTVRPIASFRRLKAPVQKGSTAPK